MNANADELLFTENSSTVIYMDELTKRQDELQAAAKRLVEESPLLGLLQKLGDPIQTGSSVTGLMVYPDIDFTVQTPNPNVQTAIDLVSTLFKELAATEVKVTDFKATDASQPAYYVGIIFPFDGESWHIDATITHPGPIVSDPPELDTWIRDMTAEQRSTVLALKKQLIAATRYVGARSQPPFTFRSSHLYEGVIKGGAHTVKELEDYFA